MMFGHLQAVGPAFAAAMHGAQDGQKFMSIAAFAIALSAGHGAAGADVFPPTALRCSYVYRHRNWRKKDY